MEKGYMGFTSGMLYGMSQTVNEDNFKQVDWERVKNYIEENKDKIESVTVGLAEDWGYTSGEVYNEDDGYIKKEDTYVYACSHWATPSMEVEFKDNTSEMMEVSKAGDDSDSYFKDVEYK